jgi:hypothetical protein
MNRINIFQVLRSRRFSALVTLVGLGLLFTASGAKAGGCSPLPYKAGAAPSIPFVSPQGEHAQEGGDSNGPVSIVGLWHLIYTAKTDNNFPPGGPYPPTPFPFLESFKTWHADGTEFENAFLPPTGGNICFGVWEDVGHGKVHLHHIGLMFQPGEGAPPEFVTSIFTVDENDAVASDGKTYSGTFDFKLFVPTQCADFDGAYACTGKPLAEVTGTTFGTRITVN